jgi:2'-5' RNA ligase
MNTHLFLAALPSHDNRLIITQKISACEAKRSPLVKVQWTHTQDLHITLGFIQHVEPADIRQIALGFMPITQNAPFMAHVEGIRLYGNAIVLQIGPIQLLQSIHRKMHQRLLEISNHKYDFLMDKRFDPHLTIGRIRNLKALNPLHKDQLMQLVEAQFRQTGFLIQQAALLKHTQETAVPSYQILQQYLFR